MKDKEKKEGNSTYNNLKLADVEEFLQDLQASSKSKKERQFIIHGGRHTKKMFDHAMKVEFDKQVEQTARELLAWQRAQPKQSRKKLKFDTKKKPTSQ